MGQLSTDKQEHLWIKCYYLGIVKLDILFSFFMFECVYVYARVCVCICVCVCVCVSEGSMCVMS